MAGASVDVQTMAYLSVHDIVWINTMLAGRTLRFNYITLEEAMAAQYSYGNSTNVPVQAANLLKVLVAKKPFEFGNIRTGFIATTAFLLANGYALKAEDAQCAETILALANGRISADEAIAALAEPSESAMRPGVTLRSLVTAIFGAHESALQSLAQGDE